MEDCEGSKASTLSVAVYGCSHKEYPCMTGLWERVAISVCGLQYAGSHITDAVLSMCVINLV